MLKRAEPLHSLLHVQAALLCSCVCIVTDRRMTVLLPVQEPTVTELQSLTGLTSGVLKRADPSGSLLICMRAVGSPSSVRIPTAHARLADAGAGSPPCQSCRA